MTDRVPLRDRLSAESGFGILVALFAAFLVLFLIGDLVVTFLTWWDR